MSAPNKQRERFSLNLRGLLVRGPAAGRVLEAAAAEIVELGVKRKKTLLSAFAQMTGRAILGQCAVNE